MSQMRTPWSINTKQKKVMGMSDNDEKLKKLDDLKKKGIITEEDFNAKKQEILKMLGVVPV